MKKYCWNHNGAGGGAGHVLQSSGGVGADDHDGARLPGGAGSGQLGVGVGRLVVARRVQHHREADALPQHGGAEVALADVGQHLRAQLDAVEDGAGAPEGDLVGGRAGDEVVVSFSSFSRAMASYSKMLTGSLAMMLPPGRRPGGEGSLRRRGRERQIIGYHWENHLPRGKRESVQVANYE